MGAVVPSTTTGTCSIDSISGSQFYTISSTQQIGLTYNLTPRITLAAATALNQAPTDGIINLGNIGDMTDEDAST
jgi:hypothetical protein